MQYMLKLVRRERFWLLENLSVLILCYKFLLNGTLALVIYKDGHDMVPAFFPSVCVQRGASAAVGLETEDYVDGHREVSKVGH